ncbi:MAG TPA: hypothetical protein VFV57_02010 [Limnobacter sp.]|nr:hypothetical protein [Limnobacter sp.]
MSTNEFGDAPEGFVCAGNPSPKQLEVVPHPVKNLALYNKASRFGSLLKTQSVI